MAFTPQQFDFQGQVPTAAIIQAYQQKAMQELQAKQQQDQANSQKHQELLQTINMASNLVQQGVQLSTQRQQKQAKEAYAGLLANPDYSPTGETQVVPGVGIVAKTAPTETWKNEMKAQFYKLHPEEYAKEQAKALFTEPDVMTPLQTAQMEKYKAETDYLKGGKQPAVKTETDVQLYEKANRDALDEAKAANKFGQMADENFLLNVKTRANELFKEYKSARDGGNLTLSGTDGSVIEITKQEWDKNKKEYIKRGFKLQ
jgi:hypothetical protein